MEKIKLFMELFDPVIKAQVKKNPKLQHYIKDIHETKKLFLNQEIIELPFHLFKLYYETGNRRKYEKVYFQRRQRLKTFGLAYWLDEDKEDLQHLEDILWAICNEYTWALPAHTLIDKPITIDLFACETAFALAEILHMNKDQLNAGVYNRCIHEIRKRVLKPFLEADEKFSWELMKNNWCAVCGGSIGIAALYLEDEINISKILQKLKTTFDNFIDSFEEDGTCLEGLAYFTYGVSFYVAFADLLKQREENLHAFLEDNELNRNSWVEETTLISSELLKCDKFKKIAAFQQKCYMNGGLTISFSDSNRHDSYYMGLTHYLAFHIDGVIVPKSGYSASYNKDHCHRWSYGIRDLLWTSIYTEKKETVNSIVKNSYCLKSAQWLICNGDYGLAIKGGSNNEPHNHNDIGSFIFYKNGQDILTDLGAGEYVKDSFNENRYNIFCNRSLSHSVPIVNGHEQIASEQSQAILKSMNENLITLDISMAYHLAYLTSLIRRVDFSHELGMVLTDSYFCEQDEVKVIERFITYLKVEIENECVIIGKDKDKTKIATFMTDLNKTITIQEFIHMDHDGLAKKVYAIDFEFLINQGKTDIKFKIN